MEINLKDKITYKNLYGILSLISNVNTLDLNGVEKGPISKVNINNVTLEQYCNYLKISHFLPKNNFTLKNIKLTGKYNIIQLVDLPRGKYYISTDKFDEEDLDENVTNTNQIDKVLNEIKDSDNTVLLKNKSNDKINIGNFDPQVYKIYYLKNLSGDSKTPTINLTYENNNTIIIVENTKANFVIHNESPNRIHCAKDENVEVESEELIEGFGETCKPTSTFQVILILMIIFIFYKLLTQRQTIKLFA